jgi:hypothetical protein
MSDIQPPPAVTDADRIAFHMTEFEALKAEIAELIKQSSLCMTFAITTCGGIAAWLLTHPGGPTVWTRWLPLAVSSLFGLLSLSYVLRVRAKAEYLRDIETVLGFAGLGWDKRSGRDPLMIGAIHTLIWGALNLGGILFACCSS